MALVGNKQRQGKSLIEFVLSDFFFWPKNIRPNHISNANRQALISLGCAIARIIYADIAEHVCVCLMFDFVFVYSFSRSHTTKRHIKCIIPSTNTTHNTENIINRLK